VDRGEGWTSSLGPPHKKALNKKLSIADKESKTVEGVQGVFSAWPWEGGGVGGNAACKKEKLSGEDLPRVGKERKGKKTFWGQGTEGSTHNGPYIVSVVIYKERKILTRGVGIDKKGNGRDFPTMS